MIRHTLTLWSARKLVRQIMTDWPSSKVDLLDIDSITIVPESGTREEVRYDPADVIKYCTQLQPKSMRRAFAIAAEFDRIDVEGCSLPTHHLMDRLRAAGEAS